MKYYTVVLLATWLNISCAVSVLNETVLDSSVVKQDSVTVTDEILPNNESVERSDMLNTFSDLPDTKQPNFEETLDIVMESIKNPAVQIDLEEPSGNHGFNLQDPSDANVDEIIPPNDADYYFNEIINKDPNEIMDTAAGFHPPTFFKRKQKHRKQVSVRRRFRNPYLYRRSFPQRRFYYFQPYYRYYRPSPFGFYY